MLRGERVFGSQPSNIRHPAFSVLLKSSNPCRGTPYTGGGHGVRLCGTFAVVKVTSTEFRKNLFQIVERALQGEFVEVAHKGRLVRLVPADKPSKMSRLIQRDTVPGTFEDLDRGQEQLDAEMRTAWEEKWSPKA